LLEFHHVAVIHAKGQSDVTDVLEEMKEQLKVGKVVLLLLRSFELCTEGFERASLL
jgi:hypothetical protein